MVGGMRWLVAGGILIVVGFLLRRLLRLDRSEVPRRRGFTPLTPDREAIYRPTVLEIETQSAILGISLNDAIEERDSAHHEIAWRLVGLTVTEWERLANIITGLLDASAKHLADVGVVVPVRNTDADRFRSQTLIDYVRMHELLDQLVFSSKRRFQLHLRVLRRAAETLTAECLHTYRYVQPAQDRSPELWKRLDLYFHDFDLVTKEALLAFRTLLVCLPHSALEAFAAEVKAVVTRSVRSTSVPADR